MGGTHSLLSQGRRKVARAASVVVIFSPMINRPPVGMMIGVHHEGPPPPSVWVFRFPHSWRADIVGVAVVADMLLLSVQVISAYSREPHRRYQEEVVASRCDRGSGQVAVMPGGQASCAVKANSRLNVGRSVLSRQILRVLAGGERKVKSVIGAVSEKGRSQFGEVSDFGTKWGSRDAEKSNSRSRHSASAPTTRSGCL